MSPWFWPSLKRELRSSWSRLLLSALCLFLATTALTSIILTDSRLTQMTQRQADLILGGDAEIFDVRPLPETLVDKIQSDARVARKTRISSFITMLSAGPGQRPRLVEAVAMDEAWPLVPGVQITPFTTHEQLRFGGVLIEKSLAITLGLSAHTQPLTQELSEKTLQKLWSERKAVRIGKKTFAVAGLVENDQMRDFASFAAGARIYMARETALKQRYVSAQSRVRDKFVVQFSADVPAAAGQRWLASELEKLGNAQPNLRTKEDALRGAFKPARGLFLFYDAVGFSILVLLGLGCAQGIHSYLSRKHADAHILSMLGAPRPQTALLYVGNVLILTAIALTLGAWAGYVSFQKLLLPSLNLWIPGVAVESSATELLSLSFRFIGGVLLLILALVLPGTISFLKQKGFEETLFRPGQTGYLKHLTSLFSAVLSRVDHFPDLVWLFAAFLLSFFISQETVFNLLLVLTLTIIYIAVRFFIRSLSRFGVASRFKMPLVLRLATSEISSRPAQSALSLMLIGLSVCLVVFLWDMRNNIVAQLTSGFSSGYRPNIFVLDSPAETEKSVREILTAGKAQGLWSEKLTRARIESINGQPPEQWLASLTQSKDDAQRAQRMINREQNLTSRSEPGADDVVTDGAFWSKESVKKSINEVSVELGLARVLGLNLGDQIIFNVQGVPVKVKVTSLRRVRWQSFRPNFFFLLHPSVLEEAPYSALIAATIPDSKLRSETLSNLFQNHPGLTSIDANEFSELAGKLVNAALEIVRLLSLMLFVGALLNALLAAWTSYTLRAKNLSLYRCLGAKNSLIMGSCLAEFLLLAGVGCLVGLAASVSLSQMVERVLLTADDHLNNSLLPGLSVGGIVLTLSATIGFISSVLILRQSPMRVLRRPN